MPENPTELPLEDECSIAGTTTECLKVSASSWPSRRLTRSALSEITAVSCRAFIDINLNEQMLGLEVAQAVNRRRFRSFKLRRPSW